MSQHYVFPDSWSNRDLGGLWLSTFVHVHQNKPKLKWKDLSVISGCVIVYCSNSNTGLVSAEVMSI